MPYSFNWYEPTIGYGYWQFSWMRGWYWAGLGFPTCRLPRRIPSGPAGPLYTRYSCKIGWF